MKARLLLIALAAALAACSQPPATPNANGTAATPNSNQSSSSDPIKDGDYNAKGVVTKINLDLGSVELDHEDIPGLMPPMRMEFNVSDKKMLDGLKNGDKVDFVIRYKSRNETIVKIEKAK